MALTLEKLQELTKAEGLHFFVAPDRPILLLAFGGNNGNHQITMSIQDDGRFFQIRTMNYFQCKTDHPHLGEVLKVLAQVNAQRRLVKFGWDPNDGEVMAYADMWVVDGTMTQAQLSRMLGNFVPTIDLDLPRLKQAFETGKDPGPIKDAPSGSPGGNVSGEVESI